MPQLNHTGPEGNGSKTGRKLGKCQSSEKSEFKLGEGMGKRRKSDENCEGEGRRIKSGKMFNNN